MDTIILHEDHREWFLKQFPTEKSVGYFLGIRIQFTEYMPKWMRKWKFPDTPFIEYNETDEVWARPIHFGYEIDTNVPAIYFIKSPSVFSVPKLYGSLQ